MRRSPWIHVSFSSTGLRRSALTRDFDDTFHMGLFLITQKTGEDRAEAQREQDDYVDKINTELTILEQRQTDLNPQTVIGDATAPGMGSAGGAAASSEDCGDSDGTVPSVMDTIWDVFNAGAPGGVPWDLTTHAGGGDFTNAVVQELGGPWGHIGKTGAQTQHNGHAVDAIGYLSPTPLYNGKFVQVIDIIRGVGGDDPLPHWHPVCAPVGNALGGDLDPNDRWYQ